MNGLHPSLSTISPANGISGTLVWCITGWEVMIAAPSEPEQPRAALNEIRAICGQRQDQPWTALSRIDQIARKALA